MKHTINLDLQQITDLDVIRAQLAQAGDKAYGKASKAAWHAGANRAKARDTRQMDIVIRLTDAAEKLEEESDELNAEGDRLMAQATLINSILTQIKKNG